MLKLEEVFMGHAVISCEEGMIVGLEECVECMCCGSGEDVRAGKRRSNEWGEVGGDELDPVGEGRGGKWGREGHDGGESREGGGGHMCVQEEAFNGGGKAQDRVVGTTESTAGSRVGNGGCHFDAECGQEGASRLLAAERNRRGTGQGRFTWEG